MNTEEEGDINTKETNAPPKLYPVRIIRTLNVNENPLSTTDPNFDPNKSFAKISQ